jgi:hypothetical protein
VFCDASGQIYVRVSFNFFFIFHPAPIPRLDAFYQNDSGKELFSEEKTLNFSTLLNVLSSAWGKD